MSEDPAAEERTRTRRPGIYPKLRKLQVLSVFERSECERDMTRTTYMDKMMLMKRSPLQPVMKPAAAGGKRMATYVA